MKKNGIIIVLGILVLIMGGYLVYDKVINKEEKSEVKVEEKSEVKEEEKDEVEHQEENNIETVENLKNYDINNIKSIEVTVPILNSNDPEMKSVTIEDNEEIKQLLLNVDNKEEVGTMDAVGFVSNVIITINYEGDPSTEIIILDNGNIAINSAVGVGETRYAEYKIENKNLASELTSKYQN